MIIINDTQLDFDDVLIAPQTTTINHRGEVDIVRVFKHLDMKCVPIISANMTQMGTFDVAKKMIDYGMCATLHKFYTKLEIVSFINRLSTDLHNLEEIDYKNLFVTVGKRNWDEEVEKLKYVVSNVNHEFSILLDVPNAYIPEITDCVKQLRELFPNKIIAVGNVCSGDETQKLILAGANFVKVGIGPSCFTGNMKIMTKEGLKKIKDIQLDDLVLTHKGNYKKVVNKFIFRDNNKFIKINNIECTPNHKFYVCNKSDISKINEKNYDKYCFWLEAEKLDNNIHSIIKIK